MPICTSCTHPTQYLYTVYNTENNLRLEICVCYLLLSVFSALTSCDEKSNCRAFADPYVEHDTLMLILDLILLKRDVYRHLLFNRGTGARKIGDPFSSRTTPRLPSEGLSRKEKPESTSELVLQCERERGKVKS